MNNDNIDILIVGDNSLDTVGGEQESTKIIINGIKNDFKLGVIQPGNKEQKNDNVVYYDLTDKTRIKHLILNPIAFLKYLLSLRKIISKEKPKIIHTQAQVSLFIIAYLIKLKLVSKDFIFIHTERGLFAKYSKFFKSIFYSSIKELDVLVTTTEYNYLFWKDALDKKKIYPKYEIIENTAGPLFEIYDSTLDKESNHGFTLGFAGRYASWKNWPLALQIIEEVNLKTNSQVNVKMAVGCLDNNALEKTKEMFQYLENLLGERFNGVININLEEMNKFYYGIDIFILTSNANTESFGRTLVEAMSRKNIALTTDSGGSVEVVGNSNNVLNSTSEFSKRIMEFYNNDNLLVEEKKNNFDRVHEKYTYKNNYKKHFELYIKLINEGE